MTASGKENSEKVGSQPPVTCATSREDWLFPRRVNQVRLPSLKGVDEWGVGALVDALQAGGYALRAAYQMTFGGLLALQVASWLWFIASGRVRKK